MGDVEMEPRKKKKVTHVICRMCDLQVCYVDMPIVKILRRYRRTGGFRRKDLRRVLGDHTKGVSAGERGLQELLSGK